jgi:hypothetical protein
MGVAELVLGVVSIEVLDVEVLDDGALVVVASVVVVVVALVVVVVAGVVVVATVAVVGALAVVVVETLPLLHDAMVARQRRRQGATRRFMALLLVGSRWR